MPPIKRSTALLLLVALLPVAAIAEDIQPHLYKGVMVGPELYAPMTFTLGQGLRDTGEIWAVGQVMPSSADTFQAFLDANKAAIKPGDTVVFDSPGGNPAAGMDIGHLLRAHGLRTSIGQRSAKLGVFAGTIEPALCASACSLAFLGGVRRSVPTGSLYGVHDVNFGEKPLGPDALVVGQEIGAEITHYIREMGVDTRLGMLASRFDSSHDETFYVSAADMAELKVTTGVVTRWALEQAGSAFMLMGRTASQVPGEDNILYLVCDKRGPARLLLGISMIPAAQMLGGGPQTPQSFASGIKSYQLMAEPGEATPAEPAPALMVAPSEVAEPLHTTGRNHVTTFLALTTRIRDYILASATLYVRLGQGPQPVDSFEGFSTDVAAGRDMIATYVTHCP